MFGIKNKNNKTSFFKNDTLLLTLKIFSFIIGFFLFQSCSILNTDNRKDRLLKQDEIVLFEKIDQLVETDQWNRKFFKNINQNFALNMDSITYVNWKDSIRVIQQKIDYKNTIELIKITKKYGFPDNSRLSKKKLSWIIFQHTPDKLKKRVKRILIKESKKGRFKSQATLKFIMWHLEGRKMDFFNNIKRNK